MIKEIIIRFGTLTKLHDIALKISPFMKEPSFSTARTYHAEIILSKAILTAHSYLRLSPPEYSDSVEYHNYDVSTLCSLSRNFIELSHAYHYLCKDKVSQEELEFRSYLLSVHYGNEMKKILINLGLSKNGVKRTTFPGLELAVGFLENNEFFLNLEPRIREQLLKGGRAFYRTKEKTYLIDKDIEASLYKIFSNHTHSFWLGLNVAYSDTLPINFRSLYCLSVETTIFYYANILHSYLSLRWKLSKRINQMEKIYIIECATDRNLKRWIEDQREFFNAKEGALFSQ